MAVEFSANFMVYVRPYLSKRNICASSVNLVHASLILCSGLATSERTDSASRLSTERNNFDASNQISIAVKTAAHDQKENN